MSKKSLLIIVAAFFTGISSSFIYANFAKKEQTAQIIPSSAYSKYVDLNKAANGWGFKKNKGAEPDIPENIKREFEKYNTYYMDQRKTKSLYLTFDEGYENGYTAKILDVLKNTKTPAAFFVTGPYLERETELVKRMVDEGHIVGNHTVNHPNLAKCGLETAEKEIKELNDKFFNQYGCNMKYLRPPEGEYSEQLLALASDMGYKTILWSLAYRDWETNKQKGADFAFSSVTPYLHDGSIILLHAVSKDNADALEKIINYAKEQGYTFKSLDELE